MSPVATLEHCLSDSPTFRRILKHNEELVDDFDVKLDRLIRAATATIDSGRTFVRNQQAFLNCLHDVNRNMEAEDEWRAAADNCLNSASNSGRLLTELLDKVSRAVERNLRNAIKSDIHRVKEMRRHFEKISDEFDSILIKSSQIPVAKASEAEEVDNLLTATRSCFLHTSLDYVNQISVFHSKKRLQILEFLLSHADACTSFFSQGNEEYQDLQPRLSDTPALLSKIREDADATEKLLEKSHSSVKSFHSLPFIPTNQDVRLEGYLFKRTSNAFKTWNRRWFMIKDNKLMYSKRNDTTGEDVTVMEVDLRLCSVKRYDQERRFCFEVVSPSKSHILQADSEQTCQYWIEAMAAGIDAAYSQLKNSPSASALRKNHSEESLLSNRGSKSSKSSSSSEIAPDARSLRPSSEILFLSDNNTCCDCSASEPKWASINLCVTLCIECSGIHRSLGVHVSKVRSLTLDDWEPSWIRLLSAIGNKISNQIFEELRDDTVERITATSSRKVREEWIRKKYVDKRFVRKEGPSGGPASPCQDNGAAINDNNSQRDSLNRALYQCVLVNDIVGVCRCLATGADVNWQNPDAGGASCLHQSVQGPAVEMSEFLLLNGAKIDTRNDCGQTAMHLAIQSGIRGQVGLLIKKGADLNVKDFSDCDLLSIALDRADADIVTLLRLAKLNEEMKHDELGNPNEELLQDMVRNFSSSTS